MYEAPQGFKTLMYDIKQKDLSCVQYPHCPVHERNHQRWTLNQSVSSIKKCLQRCNGFDMCNFVQCCNCQKSDSQSTITEKTEES